MSELLKDQDLGLLKEMVGKCLNLENKLKIVKSELQVEKSVNVQLKQEISDLNRKIVELESEKVKQINCDVIGVKQECKIDVKKIKTEQILNEDCSQNVLKEMFSQNVFQCQHPGCGKTFKNKYILAYHQNIHSAKYQCQKCEKCFPLPMHFKIHLRTHTSDRPFECDWIDCGKQFKTKGVLKQHIELNFLTHVKKLLFQCEENGCRKTFPSKGSLKQHVKTHSSLRLFQCQKRFNDLTVQNCQKRFKAKEFLKQHLLTHSTLRPFQCQALGCDKRFKTKQYLASHVKNIHSYI